MNKKKGFFKKFLKLFSLAWKASKAYIICVFLNALLGGVLVAFNVIVPKLLIDELTGSMRIEYLALYGGAITAGNLLFGFLTKTLDKYFKHTEPFVSERIVRMLAKKTMSIEYFYLEDPYYLDLKARAVFAVTTQDAIASSVKDISNIIKSVFTLAGLTAVLFTLSWWVVAVLVILFVISAAINFAFKRYEVKFFSQIQPANRKFNYYADLGYSAKYAKDVRLYGMSGMIGDRVTQYNYEMHVWFSAYERLIGVVGGANEVINVLQSALAYGYSAVRVMTSWLGPQINVGSFTMYVAAITQFSVATKQLSDAVIELMRDADFLEPFLEFLELPEISEKKGGLVLDGVGEIEFKNVTFAYPKSDKEILKNVSFKIRGGEKISIVGLNGAGKTTIVKLMCRLFYPTSGEILVNGININGYDFDSYIKEIAVVFQDYKLFNFTVCENITAGAAEDPAKLGRCLEQTGLTEKINSLPLGVDSMFGKEYDREGIEVSGGQSQKVAIARALYKGSSLVILDEPTSALDPLMEAEIYNNFNELVNGRTAIFISHRMSSSVFCDKILVIDGGEVSDFDTHANLIKKDTLYSRLFMAQANNYREGAV